jgi:hypothetical protein
MDFSQNLYANIFQYVGFTDSNIFFVALPVKQEMASIFDFTWDTLYTYVFIFRFRIEFWIFLNCQCQNFLIFILMSRMPWLALNVWFWSTYIIFTEKYNFNNLMIISFFICFQTNTIQFFQNKNFVWNIMVHLV